MKVAIHSGCVVTGDERPPEDGLVMIEDERISGLDPRAAPTDVGDAMMVDASGCVVLPGLINCHTHGVAPGPLFPSAAPAPADSVWRGNLDRHLLAGTTTVLSLCGFVTMDEIAEADRSHPVNVRGATGHTPSALQAALKADGSGLSVATMELSVEQMLEDGAVAIGELGAGHTLGGGGQDALYIPRAIERATGCRIDSHQARRIKEAALGRHIRVADYNAGAMRSALAAAGLERRLDPLAARSLIVDCVMPSFRPAVESFLEGAALSAQFGVPALLHCAAATHDVMRETARRYSPQGARLIACHSNHPSFTADEAVKLATELAGLGCLIEACTFDLLELRHLVDTREHWDRLLDTDGLVDLLATDYGHEGQHDSLMAGVADAVRTHGAPLEVAVAMATSRVGDAIPGLAPGRGRLVRGAVADLVVARADNLCDIRHVFVSGRHVVRNGVIQIGAMAA